MIMSPVTRWQVRGHDQHGSGAFAARRGTRLHPGVDLICYPGEDIVAPAASIVTKVGYTYSDDLSYRYVHAKVLSHPGLEWRIMYLSPTVGTGDRVSLGHPIGRAQDLTPRYPGITNHVHYGVRVRFPDAVLFGRSGDDLGGPEWVWIDPGILTPGGSNG